MSFNSLVNNGHRVETADPYRLPYIEKTVYKDIINFL